MLRNNLNLLTLERLLITLGNTLDLIIIFKAIAVSLFLSMEITKSSSGIGEGERVEETEVERKSLGNIT